MEKILTLEDLKNLSLEEIIEKYRDGYKLESKNSFDKDRNWYDNDIRFLDFIKFLVDAREINNKELSELSKNFELYKQSKEYLERWTDAWTLYMREINGVMTDDVIPINDIENDIDINSTDSDHSENIISKIGQQSAVMR